jgi:hypothetical protein
VKSTDGEPLLNVAALWIQALPDLLPYVEVLEPQLHTYVFPTEEIPFEINMDDDHGIKSVTLVIHYRGTEVDFGHFSFDPRELPALLLAGHNSFQFDEELSAALARYVLDGGMLIGDACCGWQDFDEAFKRFDCLLTPTSPTPAFKIGEKIEDPLTMYLSDIFTISANLAGVPGISIPCGFTKESLPIGLQILGKPFDEATVLKAAYNFEQATNYHLKRPPL